jgi:hypothetical protein
MILEPVISRTKNRSSAQIYYAKMILQIGVSPAYQGKPGCRKAQQGI